MHGPEPAHRRQCRFDMSLHTAASPDWHDMEEVGALLRRPDIAVLCCPGQEVGANLLACDARRATVGPGATEGLGSIAPWLF